VNIKALISTVLVMGLVALIIYLTVIGIAYHNPLISVGFWGVAIFIAISYNVYKDFKRKYEGGE